MSNTNLSQNGNIVNNAPQSKESFNKEFSFIDANKNKFEIKCSIKDGIFLIRGIYGDGRYQDCIKPANQVQQQLIDIWNKWCFFSNFSEEEQEKLINSFNKFESFKKAKKFLWGKDFNEYDLAYEFLESEGLNIISKSKIELPENFQENLIEIINQIEQEENKSIQPINIKPAINHELITIHRSVNLSNLRISNNAIKFLQGANEYKPFITDYLINNNSYCQKIWLTDLKNFLKSSNQKIEENLKAELSGLIDSLSSVGIDYILGYDN